MAIWFALTLISYLLGSIPAAYLAAKRVRGIDLREYGTGQMGGGNLWRMASWKLGLAVGIFDFSKGWGMVWAAQALGLDIAQQIVVGLAVITGHNWSVFMRFSGGRGVAAAIGAVLILPFINDMTPWPTLAFAVVLAGGTAITHRSALPVFLSSVILPVVSCFYEPISVTLAFLAMLLIIVIKRLMAPISAEAASVSRGQLLLNRLLLDRDIRNREDWIYRLPPEANSANQSSGEEKAEEG